MMLSHSGPAWGTISINPDAVGGTWDGTWTGKSVKEDSVWTITVHASIRGHGDGVDGMLYRAVDTITAYTPGVAFYDGILEGWTLDPHSKWGESDPGPGIELSETTFVIK